MITKFVISDSCPPPPSPSRRGREIPNPSPLAGEGRERGSWNRDLSLNVSAYDALPRDWFEEQAIINTFVFLRHLPMITMFVRDDAGHFSLRNISKLD
jgi:hypothetical protein